MSVTGELQRKAFLLGNAYAIGGVSQEDAGAAAIDLGASQGRAEAIVVGGVAIMNTDNLESIDGYLFAIEDSNAGLLYASKYFLESEILHDSRDEICSPGSRKFRERRSQLVYPGDGAVVHVAGDENDIRL